MTLMTISLSNESPLDALHRDEIRFLSVHCDIMLDWFEGRYTEHLNESSETQFLNALRFLQKHYPVAPSLLLYRGVIVPPDKPLTRYGDQDITSWTTSRSQALRFLRDARSNRIGTPAVLSKTFSGHRIYCSRETVMQFCHDLIDLVPTTSKAHRTAQTLKQHLMLPSRILQDEYICLTGNDNPQEDN